MTGIQDIYKKLHIKELNPTPVAVFVSFFIPVVAWLIEFVAQKQPFSI